MRLLLLFAAFFSVFALSAQEMPGGLVSPLSPGAEGGADSGQAKDSSLSGDTGIFPFALILEAARFAGDGNRAWRPDWPPEFPPDAFRLRSGEVSRITLEREGLSLVYSPGNPPPEPVPEAGIPFRIAEFPFMLNGGMVQAGLVYRNASELSAMTLAFPGGAVQKAELPGEDQAETIVENEPWKLEFLEYNDNYPSLVRVSRGDSWYFIVLSRGGNEITETWYDKDGGALGVYGFSLTEIGGKRLIREVRDYANPAYLSGTERQFDSRGFITEESGPGGIYKVLYFRDDLPRYWDRTGPESGTGENRTERYAFQWDENNLLLRLSSREAAEAAGTDAVERRYEYIFDGKGNWIERREICMFRVFGLLVPRPGTTVRRILEYSESE